MGRTSNDDREEGEARVSFHERVKYDAGPGAYGHSQEERRPALGEEMSYMLVPVCYDCPTNRRETENNHEDERNGCFENSKVSLGNKAQQRESNEIPET